MNYLFIDKTSVCDGDGVRTVLWVSGCSCQCHGCQNPESWDFNAGKPFTNQVKQQLFEYLNKPFISGVTLSGGHPLDRRNIDVVTALAKEIKYRFPQKTIWIYTGYIWDDVKQFECMKYTDVLIDGAFVESLKDITLQFRGSSNQRIIDVQKSLQIGDVVLWQ